MLGFYNMDCQNAFLKIVFNEHGLMLLLYVSFLSGYFFVRKFTKNLIKCPICQYEQQEILESKNDYVRLRCKGCQTKFLHLNRFD